MSYIAALDSLRGLAVLMVMLFHAKAPLAKGGYLGVDVFFVLSGFLITALLYGELARTGTISLKRFYTNRMLRLMPPLLLLITTYLVLAPILWPNHTNHSRDALLTVLYLSDYSVAFWGAPKYLSHTWSLSVEEHMYLIWPLCLLMLWRVRQHKLLAVLIGMYALASIWRIYCAGEQPWGSVYYRFDTRLSGMILGSALAVGWRLGLLPNLTMRYSWACIAGIVTVVWLARWRSEFSLQVGTLLIELLTACLITAALNSPHRYTWLAHPALVYLGKISYGVYLFHYPAMLFLRPHTEWMITLLVGGGLSVLIAAASFHSIEAWARGFRKLRSSRGIDSKADVIDVEVVGRP